MSIKQFIGDSKFVVIAFDRSGSTLEETARREQNALCSALAGMSGFTAIVMAFDHNFQLVGSIGSASEARALKIPLLAGGSMLTPVTKFARDVGAEKLIVFTDGYISDFGNQQVPTLFVLNNEEELHVIPKMPYGTVEFM